VTFDSLLDVQFILDFPQLLNHLGKITVSIKAVADKKIANITTDKILIFSFLSSLLLVIGQFR